MFRLSVIVHWPSEKRVWNWVQRDLVLEWPWLVGAVRNQYGLVPGAKAFRGLVPRRIVGRSGALWDRPDGGSPWWAPVGPRGQVVGLAPGRGPYGRGLPPMCAALCWLLVVKLSLMACQPVAPTDMLGARNIRFWCQGRAGCLGACVWLTRALGRWVPRFPPRRPPCGSTESTPELVAEDKGLMVMLPGLVTHSLSCMSSLDGISAQWS